MNNKQILDLTSPPSAEFDTAQACFYNAIIMQKQNGYAVATQIPKEKKNITIKCDFGGNY